MEAFGKTRVFLSWLLLGVKQDLILRFETSDDDTSNTKSKINLKNMERAEILKN